ncbi:hypothetical protein [Microvirga brassicacearum]|uniref:PepSY domain-containing protein n=1 Tax=Microvirga brassicacearum TaxID=2580413 RepID=A0A5N3PJ16_9HYPH|nr:hypothetical protein [Microvirga brassicacearum]KAB0269732.1 hypothetical protein FEZ63_00235 [Microvirga brassicacearum]
MFQVPATVMGMIGSAFMVASFAPGAVGHAANSEMESAAFIAKSQTVDASGKRDRVTAPVTAKSRQAVSVVELVGVSRVQVVLKDENGVVLFRSDPQTNTTYVARDTDLPVITVKHETGSQTKPQPVSRESSEESVAPKRRAHPYGCVGAVSPLARAGNEAAPSLCVTSLESGIQARS